ncbi:MAG: phosphatidylglycerophosphatase A [Bacteroidota bacterium]|nr:phosphatidylglycerophosphatase A [Bacteroidota bacterium]
MRAIIKKKKIVDADAKVDFFSVIFSSFFYSGFFPTISGTIGSLASLIIFFFDIFYNPVVLLILILLTFFIGIYTSERMIKRYGDDPSVIVIDEAVGMWLTILIFISFPGTDLSWFYILVCFLSFRIFDILKLQPARYYDNLKTAYGIMMDDIIAAVYAGVLAYLISLSRYNPF